MPHYIPPGPLGFGGAPLGNMYEVVDDDTAEATLVAAWQSGVRHFDTAPGYGRGAGEHRFGRVLRRYPRDAFVISTKVGRLLRPEGSVSRTAMHIEGPSSVEHSVFKSGLPFVVEVDYGYDAAMRSFEDSLQRLGMDKIDLLYVHDLGVDHLGDQWAVQFDVARRGCFRALSELRDQGVIRAWGLGNNVVEPCIRALEQADPDVFQLAGRYSLLDQSALDRLLPMCAERGVTVVVGGPYNSDVLAQGSHYDYKAASPQVMAQRDRIATICARHGTDIRSVALQFCAAHPVVSTVIPGSRHPDEARDNARFMSAQVPPAVWQELKADRFIREDAPVPA